MEPIAGGSELFSSYHSDLQCIFVSLRSILQSLPPSSINVSTNDTIINSIQGGKDIVGNNNNNNKDRRKAILRTAEREIDEADEILSQMDNELHSLPGNGTGRKKMKDVYNTAKIELASIKAEFKSASSVEINQRDELLGGVSKGSKSLNGGFDDRKTDPQSRLLQGTEQLNRTSDRLTNAHRVALESEQSGILTLQNLRQQREQLQRTRNTMREVDGNLDRAQRSLRSMTNRLLSNKLLTIGIVVILVLIILMIILVKLM